MILTIRPVQGRERDLNGNDTLAVILMSSILVLFHWKPKAPFMCMTKDPPVAAGGERGREYPEYSLLGAYGSSLKSTDKSVCIWFRRPCYHRQAGTKEAVVARWVRWGEYLSG
jgi:hypothetical protein